MSSPAAPKRRRPPPGQQPADSLRILLVTSECVPFAKVGGLADAVAGLAKALHRLGHEVRILLPLYASIDRARHALQFIGPTCVHMGGPVEQWIGLYRGMVDGEVPAWFVDYDRFFGRAGIYDGPWGEHGDNAFRFALLSKSALQVCRDQQFTADVMHAHDWPTALVPAYLKTWDRALSPFAATASVLTIHNIGYQGKSPVAAFPYIGVGWQHFVSEKFEDHGDLNLLKAGIAFADSLTTVSPSYAGEILQPAGGHGLAPYLSARRPDLFGILNGADYERWNPATDRMIPVRYTPEDAGGKIICKAALQERFQLTVRPDWPVFGIVSRLVAQKGFELARQALPEALRTMVIQVVVLGTGDTRTEDFFRRLPAAFPGRVGVHIGFSDELSHLIQAGSDCFLMPSLYEPCGLGQMYAMKYGSLPVVRATGGLDDTVENYDEHSGRGTGFKFRDPDPRALGNTIGWAVSTWYDRPQHFLALRRQAMAREFSWEESARRYVEVYRRALDRRRAAVAGTVV